MSSKKEPIVFFFKLFDSEWNDIVISFRYRLKLENRNIMTFSYLIENYTNYEVICIS